uniref:Uncharacterized protein n=1 Tax=Fungal sp. (strain NRRL 50135) TaxID=1547289 RepID=A0A089FRP3_FUNXX|nr:hypothetical protein gNR603 [fungal sp. NRRL 50135]
MESPAAWKIVPTLGSIDAVPTNRTQIPASEAQRKVWIRFAAMGRWPSNVQAKHDRTNDPVRFDDLASRSYGLRIRIQRRVPAPSAAQGGVAYLHALRVRDAVKRETKSVLRLCSDLSRAVRIVIIKGSFGTIGLDQVVAVWRAGHYWCEARQTEKLALEANGGRDLDESKGVSPDILGESSVSWLKGVHPHDSGTDTVADLDVVFCGVQSDLHDDSSKVTTAYCPRRDVLSTHFGIDGVHRHCLGPDDNNVSLGLWNWRIVRELHATLVVAHNCGLGTASLLQASHVV